MPADHSPTALPTARPLGAPISLALSPQEAAARAKMSRRTIMRAVEAGELAARRDNRNRWNIALEDLDRWAGGQWAPSAQRPEAAHSDSPNGTALKLAAAQATIAQLELRLAERDALVAAAMAERDRWRSLAERLAAREVPSPPLQATPPPPPPRRWWLWPRR